MSQSDIWIMKSAISYKVCSSYMAEQWEMHLLQNTAVYIIICASLIIFKRMKRIKLENYLWICKALLKMFYSEDLLLLICIDKYHLAAPMLMCYQGMRGFFLILRPHAKTQTETQTCIQTYSHTLLFYSFSTKCFGPLSSPFSSFTASYSFNSCGM